ncbi:hypothetical protein FN846DRAFT_898317 [Sphaerosporella brunnea]|uniref:Uncharacterized protein n=1 Tax=Sphaerosporella brunnea TaxID=1250544 RepID=A0A5J5F1L5_9PEZI|nr:hypothetical protein FN846DRAFT_898317 [Sphaerosporella brunnea]
MSGLAAPQGNELAEFQEALQHVYGPFGEAVASEDAAQKWTPAPLEEGHRGRYLWTDAFGVLNFLTLHMLTSEPHYLTFAHRLIETVHSVLGRTRDGTSFLPGASESAPLSGGLRIGKREEHGPDGDGQYHHYLTLWMFALNRYSVAAADPHYNSLGIQLARAIHPAFVTGRGTDRPRIYWKVSMDLSRPLVPSQGNLDPFDGYVIFKLLDEHKMSGEEGLEKEIEDYRKIVQENWRRYHSEDPLDLGMSLWTAHWRLEEEWARHMKEAAVDSLRQLEQNGEFDVDPGHRIAFREFGSVMGIKCYDDLIAQDYWHYWIAKLLAGWRKVGLVPTPKRGSAALRSVNVQLKAITEVMFCAALIPGAFRKGWVEAHMKR